MSHWNLPTAVASREAVGHPDWCARGHRCGLGEHRAEPITLAVPGCGGVVLTRVQGANGRQHAEIRARIVLADGEPAARAHLARVLAELGPYLRRVIQRPHP
jgi:hypothetical protein